MPNKIIVPDTNPEARVVAPSGVAAPKTNQKTPACPVCGAKFSHDFQQARCSKCGLPDEIAVMDKRMIARWAKRQGIFKPVGARKSAKKTKHGRVGVKR